MTDVFTKKHGYLFTSINKNNFLVSEKLAEPGFFRNRYSFALGNPEKGNWRKMNENNILMNKVNDEIKDLIKKWKNFDK